MAFNRPMSRQGSYVTTPRAAEMLEFTLGDGSGPVSVTHDEFTAIRRLYGYAAETRGAKDERTLLQVGADTNAFRHAEADGLRLVAWLAKYVEPGEDPLKMLVSLAIAAGLDVDPADVDWCHGEESAELLAGVCPHDDARVVYPLGSEDDST